jgi:hypothetical protein
MLEKWRPWERFFNFEWLDKRRLFRWLAFFLFRLGVGGLIGLASSRAELILVRLRVLLVVGGVRIAVRNGNGNVFDVALMLSQIVNYVGVTSWDLDNRGFTCCNRLKPLTL